MNHKEFTRMNYDGPEFSPPRLWRSFPKSLGMVVAALYLAIDVAPRRALTLGLAVTAALYLLYRWRPNLYETDLWTYLEPPARLLARQPLRWLMVTGLGFLAYSHGLSLERSLEVIATILLFDVLLMLVFRQV
jgi:hypothetical protein